MIAMQYKIMLADDFDMDIIRKRVAVNGTKTDGFQDLLFKVYLISENHNMERGKNEYSPLYLWKNNMGMNTFIFSGPYDNILDSFGWQNINVGVPLSYTLESNFAQSHYALEIEHGIEPTLKMKPVHFSLSFDNSTGEILIYNPDKWRYVEYYFFSEPPADVDGRLYEILHISM